MIKQISLFFIIIQFILQPMLLNENSESIRENTKEYINIYYSNEDSSGIISKNIEIKKLSPELLIEELINENVFNKGITINEFKIDKNEAIIGYLDLSQDFLKQLNNMGTCGESIMINSLVNTFIDNYNLDKLKVTIDGEIISTGHNIYEDYFYMD